MTWLAVLVVAVYVAALFLVWHDLQSLIERCPPFAAEDTEATESAES